MLWFRRLFGLQPPGFTLIRNDGSRHNRIRGDLIPVEALVVEEDGRSFVRTNETDESGFDVYREGHATFAYVSQNA